MHKVATVIVIERW